MIRTSSVPSTKLTYRVWARIWAPWSYSPHPARLLVLRLWHHLHEPARIQKLVGFFSLNANSSFESSLLDVTHPHRVDSFLGLLDSCHHWCSNGCRATLSVCQTKHEQLGMTLSAALPCIINLLATEKHLTSDGLVFFFFTWVRRCGNRRQTFSCVSRLVEVRQQNTGTVITRIWPPLVMKERPLCSGSRRQTVDCSSSFSRLCPPTCRDV